MTVVIPLSSRVKRYPSNVRIEPDGSNGLSVPSDIVVGQITSITKQALGSKIGALSAADMTRVEGVLAYVLGLGN
jgi:mRNA-degrading endonuclease toxin of MazEF toxin-antitoxin module